MNPAIKWTYVALLATVCAAIALFGSDDPYGANFIARLVPCLIALYLLQWFVIPLKPIYRASGFLVTLFIIILLSHLVDLRAVTFPRLVLGLLTAVAAYMSLFLWLTSLPAIRNVAIAQSLTATFILLLGLFMTTHGVRFEIVTDEGFLLWSPLAAMLLWTISAMFRWTKVGRVLFILILGQIAIGFLDVGMGQHIPVMTAFSAFFLASALLLLIRWAEILQKSKKSEPTL